MAAILALSLSTSSAQALNDNPTLAEANRLASKKSYAEAEKLYLKVLSETPDNAFARQMYGRVLALQGRFDEALKEYKQSLKRAPRDATILNDVGVTLSVVGLRELAARFLNQAVKSNSKYAAAMNNLGVTLDKIKAYRQAFETFGKSLEIQPTNLKIKELKAKTEAKLPESKDFDFGGPVSWQDIPDTIPDKTVEETPQAPEVAVDSAPKPKRVYKRQIIDDEDQEFLNEAQPLFLEFKTEGFTQALVSGTGLVQLGSRSDSADNTREVDLTDHPKFEVSGEVVLDLVGKGQVELGDATVSAQDDECTFSVNVATKEITCYAGTFQASKWSSVQATRATTKVQVEADKCQSVYGQDDSRIDAKDCIQVALVGHAQGTMVNCQNVVLNDQSRAVAQGCKKLTVMSKARAKAQDCAEIEELDQAKVEVSK